MSKIKRGRDNAVLVDQDRPPNFRGKGEYNGQLFLVRCFACGGECGRENYAPSVASGQCAWCGWKEEVKHE